MEEKIEFYKEIEFKDTEIGKIPKEWEVVKLDEVSIKIKAGGTPLTSKKEYYNGNIPFVKIEDMTRSYKYLRSTSTTITEAGLKNSNAWLVPANSLLVAIYASIGVIAINTIEVTTNQAILSVLPIEGKTNVEFLFYALTYLKPLLKKYTKETTQKNLTGEIMKNFKVALPSLSEQQKITSILSTVDESIQKTDDIIAKTERLKKGLMQELLTKGIGHNEYVEIGIGKFPKDWKVVKLGNVITYIKGKKPKRMTEEHQRGYFPYLSAEYLRNNEVTKFAEPSQDVILVKEGDLILLWDGSNAGEFFLGKQGILSSTMVRIEQEKPSYDQKFLFYLLKAKEGFLKGQTKGTGIPHVNEDVLNNLVIPDPPLVEQRKISEILLTADEKLENLRRERTKLEKIKQWFMEELLTGRIRVRVT